MSDSRKNREEEKNRLWQEIINHRKSSSSSPKDDIVLAAGDVTSQPQSPMLSPDKALAELNDILKKQQKDLEKLSEATVNEYNRPAFDIDKLADDLHDDYGVTETADRKPGFDPDAVFAQMKSDVNAVVIGQEKAVDALCAGLKRPYVTGSRNDVRNVILISGPEGSGRHKALAAAAESLAAQKLFASDEVDVIDMSLYASASQEQVFLQDLYQALNSPGSALVFENFEKAFPSFLRNIEELVEKGRFTLNERYVLTKGALAKAQGGLVKEAIDHLDGHDKYLIFITANSLGKVQDSLGGDFMKHVADTVVFKTLDEESLRKIIAEGAKDLIAKTKKQIGLSLSIDEDVEKWVYDHFNKRRGAEGINELFDDMYICLSQEVLTGRAKAADEVKIAPGDNGEPVGFFAGFEAAMVRSDNREEELAQVNKELDEIVGLKDIKEYIRTLQAHILLQKRRREQGLKEAQVAMHMIFTGNPGTGKTTIARLLGRYMKAIGALSRGQLVEVSRPDLVAQYVGQTAPLTMSVVKSALGGVLFIDEAYGLYRGKDDAFGLEAIDTLVKAMEDNRDDLMVILAGYKKEMSTFLEANSGLKSRFSQIIEFPDYAPGELLEIARFQAADKGYEIAAEANEKLLKYFAEVQKNFAAQAGNGRLARNTVEGAILHQALRISQAGKEPDSVLTAEDFACEMNFEK